VRTALINYLFAKSKGGSFILRLEDTDRTRYSPEYVQNLYDTFKWLGFYWTKGLMWAAPAAPMCSPKDSISIGDTPKSS
jgi:glutamyl-tRNA synthetase